MKRVLLTGASGFVGRQTIGPLRARGYEVHATTSIARPAQEGIVWHRVDLLASGHGRELVAQILPSHLLHLAWYAEPGKYWQSPMNLKWLAASLELLLAFEEHGGRRAVLTGTCAEYDWSHGVCDEVATPRRPHTVYGTCKNALGETLEALSRQSGLSSAWARLFFLYGPEEQNVRLVPSVVCALLDDRPANCTHGKQLRDFLYVADVADALTALLGSDVEGPVNISSGEPVELATLVGEIARQLERPHLIRLGAFPAPEPDPPLLVGPCKRLRDEVSWKPAWDLSGGIAETIAWWRQHRSAQLA
jgi:nucleoside-diphosphate-sugar epimerase